MTGMNEGDQKPAGWFDGLRRVGDSLLGLAQTRFELFTVELQEEKLRVVKLLIWLAVALALGLGGLLIVVGTLALFLWQVAGYAGLLGLALVVLGGAAGILWTIYHRVRKGPLPFSQTVTEFKKDREWLRKKN